MTEHESQAIFKIVIPYEEYQRLKAIEVQFHNLQKQFVTLQSEKKLKEKIPEESDTNISATNNTIDDLNGSGETVEPSQTTVPTLLEINEQRPDLIQPDILYTKNDESSKSEDAKLLSTVPKAHQNRALSLITLLNDRSSELTWDKDGIIFIDQTPIPHTNIFKIFRYLFVRQKPLAENGYLELYDKIQSMGLNHLINIRHRIREAKVIKKEVNKDPSFWYLG